MKRSSSSAAPDAKKAKKSKKESRPSCIDPSANDHFEANSGHVLYFDGGCRNNQNTAHSLSGFGALIKKNGVKVYETSKFMGGNHTNNEAEYSALLAGLSACRDMKIKEVVCVGDSSLVVNQMRGLWKINVDRLLELNTKCTEVCKTLDKVRFCFVRREFNKEADALANEAMDSRTSWTRVVVPDKKPTERIKE